MATQSEDARPATREEMMSVLFANLVIQQTNMALMFLGRVPHPETKERVKEPDMARMFIDQLEMLEAKTKGNLDKQEENLLRQSLTTLRMAFVEAVNEEKTKPSPEAESTETKDAAPAAEAEDSRKKFTKKY